MTQPPPGDALLLRLRPYRPRSLPRFERQAELLSIVLFVAVAAAMVALAPHEALPPAWALTALVAAFALTARVRVWWGAGSTVPTQLVLVPALFALPPAAVPPVMALALCADALADFVRGRQPPVRIAAAVGGAWHALAPTLVFVVAGAPAAELDAAPVLAVALGAQFSLDVAVSLIRERLGRAMPARSLLPVLLGVCAGDLALAPVGFAAAVATDGSVAALLLVMPALALLAALTRDRNARLVEATERVEELRRERGRVGDASRRLGRAFGATFSRDALVELVEASAADALDCEPGDVMIELGTPPEPGCSAPESRPLEADLLTRALAAAPLTGGCAALREGDLHALAHIVPNLGDGPCGALAVMRRGRRFSPGERELLGLLANQAAAGLENVSLHEQVRRQAVTDELTGLANRRAFRTRLAEAVERARRDGPAISLMLVDLDHFKTVNDAYGHLEGDRVLATVARRLRAAARSVDLAARYGGEELALLMPGTDARGATAAAERLRADLESLSIPMSSGEEIAITASFGVATATGPSAVARELLAAADAALYEAKRAGRNCVRTAPGVRELAG